eukprot:CAMPEP_0116838520 /NCGR_PEP_ID=MMETSP0418-20121206/9261_1 /TAXON_ID=1158023 /ORGANISM="Astrosyne radiata, Strain 13vi08-1A" /LENGTH=217 /DNA_ID=CAMNT_0004468537 /DNA_START=122 /DNA_END=775 /DNA_ORIENTATION=-
MMQTAPEAITDPVVKKLAIALKKVGFRTKVTFHEETGLWRFVVVYVTLTIVEIRESCALLSTRVYKPPEDISGAVPFVLDHVQRRLPTVRLQFNKDANEIELLQDMPLYLLNEESFPEFKDFTDQICKTSVSVRNSTLDAQKVYKSDPSRYQATGTNKNKEDRRKKLSRQRRFIFRRRFIHTRNDAALEPAADPEDVVAKHCSSSSTMILDDVMSPF